MGLVGPSFGPFDEFHGEDEGHSEWLSGAGDEGRGLLRQVPVERRSGSAASRTVPVLVVHVRRHANTPKRTARQPPRRTPLPSLALLRGRAADAGSHGEQHPSAAGSPRRPSCPPVGGSKAWRRRSDTGRERPSSSTDGGVAVELDIRNCWAGRARPPRCCLCT